MLEIKSYSTAKKTTYIIFLNKSIKVREINFLIKIVNLRQKHYFI